MPKSPQILTTESSKRSRDPSGQMDTQYLRKRRQSPDNTIGAGRASFPLDMSLGLSQEADYTLLSPTYSDSTDPGTGISQDTVDMPPWDGMSDSLNLPFELSTPDFPPYDLYSQPSFFPDANQTSPAVAPSDINSDLEMEIELNTDMGLIWRPSFDETFRHDTLTTQFALNQPDDASSSSQYLDPSAETPIGGGAAQFNGQPERKDDGFGVAGKTTKKPDQRLERTLADLDRLYRSLKADTREKINMVDAERRASLA